MKKKAQTEREQEKLYPSTEVEFNIPEPIEENNKGTVVPTKEKTSLYIPKAALMKNCTFEEATFSSKVKITRNIEKVMETIFKYGAVAKRYGENGLENDPTKQQIIIYTAITCQNHLLWYQRATAASVGEKAKKFLGDARLQGKLSVGFGGHKTEDDIEISKKELSFVEELLPALKDELAIMIGLNKGFFAEIEEELGIKRENIKNIKLAGAFFDERFEDPSVEIQVGWVHTGIAAFIEIDPETTDTLKFNMREIANVWWIPSSKVLKDLENKLRDYQKGKGPSVEGWTEVMIREFWQEYFQK